MSNIINLPAIRPSLLLDFANSKTVDPRITFTRASTATYFDAQGLMRTAASGVLRIDHDPATGACKGLLIEESRTNLLRNSLISGASLATQSVTVTAVAHTLSFYGTGTVTLSGAHTATVVGAGAYPVRNTLTFTPTGGALTLTVTGTVRFANLERGGFPTSYIPTTSAAATRAADVASITGANFSSWYRQDEGAFVAEYFSKSGRTGKNSSIFSATASAANRNDVIGVFHGSAGSNALSVVTGGVSQTYLSATVLFYEDAANKVAASYGAVGFARSLNGTTAVAGSPGVLPTINTLLIGSESVGGVTPLCGHIRALAYYPKRLSNAEMQALTA